MRVVNYWVIIGLFFVGSAWADEITLNSGRKIKCAMVWEADGKVFCRKSGGVDMSYLRGDVADYKSEKKPAPPKRTPAARTPTGQTETVQTSCNPIAAISEAKASADIKRRVRERYPNKYSMQKTLYDSDMEAYRVLRKQDHPVICRIIKDKMHYYPKFNMIKTLVEQNVKDYNAMAD